MKLCGLNFYGNAKIKKKTRNFLWHPHSWSLSPGWRCLKALMPPRKKRSQKMSQQRLAALVLSCFTHAAWGLVAAAATQAAAAAADA